MTRTLRILVYRNKMSDDSIESGKPDEPNQSNLSLEADGQQASSVQSIHLGDSIDNINDDFEELDMDALEDEDRPSPEYDALWKNQAAFEVENFASNYGLKRKWTDIVWAVIYWINFIISVVLFFLSKPWAASSYSTKEGKLSRNDMVVIGCVSIGISFAFCFLTYMFVLIAPRIYVLGVFGLCVIAIWGFGIPIAIVASPYYLIVCVFSFIVCVFTVFCMCGRLQFSADVMKSSALIIRRIPSTLLFNFCIYLVQAVISYLFSCGAVLVYCLDISYWLYVYIVISYFWIVQTINYVSYTTVAGVASTWYFLNETEYMPKTPLLTSLYNALGPSFGPCALAGFLEGISSAFNWIKDKGETLPCTQGGCCFSCFKCCCGCFATAVKCIIGAIDRYSLIYCAMFGTPAKEGVKRWKAVKKKKIVKQVLNSCIVSLTFKVYAYSSMAVGSSLGGLLAKVLFEKNSPPFIFLSAIAGTSAFNGMELISKIIEVMSDTLFVGFSEAPLRLENGAKDIYNLFKGRTKEMLDKEIRAAKGIEEPKTWWQKIFCCFGCCN